MEVFGLQMIIKKVVFGLETKLDPDSLMQDSYVPIFNLDLTPSAGFGSCAVNLIMLER